jgi:hypothetical protein
MLLFFIAQTTAIAVNCNSYNSNFVDMSYTIKLCEESIKNEFEIAKDWWHNKGEDVTLAQGTFDCKEEPGKGEIYVKIDNNAVRKYDSDTRTRALTVRTHFLHHETVHSSIIYITTNLLENREKLQTFAIHELGHAIGYDHVPESCKGFIMNPFLDGMGQNL